MTPELRTKVEALLERRAELAGAEKALAMAEDAREKAYNKYDRAKPIAREGIWCEYRSEVVVFGGAVLRVCQSGTTQQKSFTIDDCTVIDLDDESSKAALKAALNNPYLTPEAIRQGEELLEAMEDSP